jgi:hypothetical protein
MEIVMRLFLIALAAPALVLTASCAPTSPGLQVDAASARQCFMPSQVTNFRTSQEHTTYVRTLRDGVFALNGGFCRDLNRANAIVVEPQIGNRACAGDTATVRYTSLSGGAETCRVTVSARLSDAEIAALPGSARP